MGIWITACRAAISMVFAADLVYTGNADRAPEHAKGFCTDALMVGFR